MKSGSKDRPRPSPREIGECGDLGSAPRVRDGNQGQVALNDCRGPLRSPPCLRAGRSSGAVPPGRCPQSVKGDAAFAK
jgi:hypothetical protein